MTKTLHGLMHGWLGLLALSGVLRILNGLLFAALGWQPLGLLIGPIEFVALLLTGSLWGIAFITPRVPLRVVILPMLMMGWMMLGALPFSVMFFNGPWFDLITGIMWLVVVGASMGLSLTVAGDRPMLQVESLDERPALSWKRTLGWLGANVLGSPALVVAYLVISVSWTLSWGTAGFMSMTPTGIAAAHRTYTLGDDRVHLIGMVHIGEESAYRKLFVGIPEGPGSLVLSEGVRDEQHLLTAPGDAYGKAASNVGLSAQKPIEELSAIEVKNADVDVSDFDPLTIELLNAVLGLYGAGDNLQPALMNYLAFWMDHQSDAKEVLEVIFDDILSARNRKLIAEIEANIGERDHIVVPWGALHLVEVEQHMVDSGWVLSDTKKVVLIPWAALGG